MSEIKIFNCHYEFVMIGEFSERMKERDADKERTH